MILTWRKILTSSILLLVSVSFFCPYYKYTTNKMTVTFSLTCGIALLCCLLLHRMKRYSEKKHTLLAMLIFVYAIVFLLTNIMYIGCYWEMANRLICFWLFLELMYKGKPFLTSPEIKRWLIRISFLAIVFSLLLYCFGIEELSFANNINYRLQGQHFVDLRLTYVFGHKSGYGLILLILLFFVLNNRDMFNNKFQFYLYIIIDVIGIVVSGSATSWCGLIIMVACMFMGKISKKMKIHIFLGLVILLLLAPIIVLKLYNYLMVNRNFSTGGSRLLIWTIALNYLSKHLIGLGDNFYTTIIDGVNNFHNVFFNEMLHFSVPVGLLYFMIFIGIFVVFCKEHRFNFFTTVALWVPLFILLIIDQSLPVQNLPLFILLICFVVYSGDDCGSSREKKCLETT